MGAVRYGMNYAGGILGSSTEYGLKISNCYNIGSLLAAGRSDVIVGNGVNSNSITNCYYLADEETAETNGVTGKTAAQFKSGEVAYLLQAGQNEAVWGQTIGTDAHPVLDGAKKVYRNEAYDGCQAGKRTGTV